jgi:hypothetical protein
LLENRHSPDGLLNDNPGFVAELAFGDLDPVVVAGSFEFASVDRRQAGRGIVCGAPSFEIEDYW